MGRMSFMVVLLGSAVLAGSGLRGGAGHAAAQEGYPPVAPGGEAAPAVPPAEGDEMAAPQEALLPPPPADVMRPTRHGFRLTPGMMRVGVRSWLREGPFSDVQLDDRQEAALGEKFASRVLEAAHRHGEAVRDFLETYFENMVGDEKTLTGEVRRRFGQQGSALVPVFRDLIRDFARDARPLLTDAQWELFKEDLRREFQNIERAEGNLQRWARGEAGDHEDLDDLDLESSASGESGGAPGRDRTALRRAQRRADRDLRDPGFASWRAFLASAAAFFKFDEAQKRRGEEILADHRRQAEPIMTASWRRRVRDNRVRYHLRGALKGDGLEPWVFHLESEYNELMGPIREIENSLRDAVIALARPDQREAAAAELRDRAAQHGLQFNELDAAMPGMRTE